MLLDMGSKMNDSQIEYSDVPTANIESNCSRSSGCCTGNLISADVLHGNESSLNLGDTRFISSHFTKDSIVQVAPNPMESQRIQGCAPKAFVRYSDGATPSDLNLPVQLCNSSCRSLNQTYLEIDTHKIRSSSMFMREDDAALLESIHSQSYSNIIADHSIGWGLERSSISTRSQVCCIDTRKRSSSTASTTTTASITASSLTDSASELKMSTPPSPSNVWLIPGAIYDNSSKSMISTYSTLKRSSSSLLSSLPFTRITGFSPGMFIPRKGSIEAKPFPDEIDNSLAPDQRSLPSSLPGIGREKYARNTVCLLPGASYNSGNSFAEDSLHSNTGFSSRFPPRVALSGEVWTHGKLLTDPQGRNDMERIGLDNKQQRMYDVVEFVRESDEKVYGDRFPTISCKIPRSVSMERRLCEAAQFAEAVGDVVDDEEIQIVDRDDDDDCNSSDGGLIPDAEQIKSITVDRSEHEQRHKLMDADNPNFNGDVSESLEPDNFCKYSNSKKTDCIIRTVSNVLNQEDALPSCEIQLRNSTSTNNSGTERRRFSMGNRIDSFLDKLPDDYNSAPAASKQLDFVYKGIHSNPPEIVKRGTQRGNYAQLHRKAWLEVSDKHHRYGKNLRLYYKHWESLGFPTNMFFDWLDSKGEATGQPLPDLEECPRSKLDSDTVLYITDPERTKEYSLNFVPIDDVAIRSSEKITTLKRGLVLEINDQVVKTGPEGWIFVLRDNVMYGAPKVTSTRHMPPHNDLQSKRPNQRFHHSSFFGGKAVAAAGIFITDNDGMLTRLYPHSGHYRPGEAHMQRVLFHLHHIGIDLHTFEVDTQQIVHIARDYPGPAKDESNKLDCNDGKTQSAVTSDAALTSFLPSFQDQAKTKKTESLYLMPAILVASYLAHKARFIGEGIFKQIHMILTKGPEITSVSEALNVIDPCPS